MRDTESQDQDVWPAFVDLLAATAMLFLVLFTVIAIPLMRRTAESQGVETRLDTLTAQLKRELIGRRVAVERRANFVFLRITGDATFPKDSAGLSALRAEGKAILRDLANVVRNRGMLDNVFQFQVVGHASREGATSMNWTLSAARASAVAQFLVDSVGLDPCKVSAVGRSSFYPVGASLDIEQPVDPRDRRIEVEVLPRFSTDTLQEQLLGRCRRR
jgi:outer membrane protein OmpA-like peptidoglycan-associated protein